MKHQRIRKLILSILEKWKFQYEDSQALYDHIAKHLPGSLLIQEAERIIRNEARNVIRTWRNEHGERVIESVPSLDGDGRQLHLWIKPDDMNEQSARDCVDGVAGNARSQMRKANGLAKRFNRVQGFQFEIPFPWIEEEATGSEP